MIKEYELSGAGQERVLRAREEWLSNPRDTLYRMAHSDDLVFPANFRELLMEARAVFAPHAIELADAEDNFFPLNTYATLGFDRKDPEFARKVIHKAIRACPSTEVPFARMVVSLIQLCQPVSELQDRPFFDEIEENGNQHESVRNAARSVIEAIDEKASVTERFPPSAGESDGIPARRMVSPIKDDSSGALRAWIAGGLLSLLIAGVIIFKILGRARNA